MKTKICRRQKLMRQCFDDEQQIKRPLFLDKAITGLKHCTSVLQRNSTSQDSSLPHGFLMKTSRHFNKLVLLHQMTHLHLKYLWQELRYDRKTVDTNNIEVGMGITASISMKKECLQSSCQRSLII